MKSKVSLYLAGSIKKSHEFTNGQFWTEQEMEQLQQALPDFHVSFLNPSVRFDDLSDQFSVFGRDMLQVFCCDVVLVDARGRRGLGVGAEMMWAKANCIPVVTWVPRDTHYHKSHAIILDKEVSNWVHPFVECLSDHMVENLEEAARVIAGYKSGQTPEVKDLSHMYAAMEHYKATQLAVDTPMKNLFEANEEVGTRAESLQRDLVCL